MTGRGRRVVWGLGAGSMAVLTATSALWPEINSNYELRRLRQDPARLEGMIGSRSPGARKALKRFAREPSGREAVLRLYLGECGPLIEHSMRAGSRRPMASEGVFLRTTDQVMWLTWGGIVGRGERRFMKPVGWKPGIATGLAEVLAECCGAGLDLPEMPFLQFQLHDLEQNAL